MPLPLAVGDEPFAATCNSALEVLLVQMVPHVHVQVAGLGERLRAELTLVGLLPRVLADVRSQSAVALEGVGAVGAGEGSDMVNQRRRVVPQISVPQHMVLQVAFGSEAVPTLLALEGLDAQMSFAVALEIALLVKRLAALLTLIGRLLAQLNGYNKFLRGLYLDAAAKWTGASKS